MFAMFRFTTRDVLWLTMVVAISLGWFIHYRSLTQRGLYSDGEVQALVSEHTVELGEPGNADYLVVMAGTTMPRNKVFATLGIEERRLKDFRSYTANHGCTLLWQISPRFDIACQTAMWDPANSGLTVGDDKRTVYGIEIREREGGLPLNRVDDLDK